MVWLLLNVYGIVSGYVYLLIHICLVNDPSYGPTCSLILLSLIFSKFFHLVIVSGHLAEN